MVVIRREGPGSLAAYGSIPAAFEVPAAPGGRAWIKDYDAIPGNGPLEWPGRFGVDDWTFLGAFDGERRVGGAVVIAGEDAIAQVAGRRGFAVLWDIRVHPSARRTGVARALLASAEDVARDAGLRGLDAETQNVNVAACRLYASRGFVLTRSVDGAYPDLPAETMLIWTKEFPHD